jgi:hypothetical protein
MQRKLNPTTVAILIAVVVVLIVVMGWQLLSRKGSVPQSPPTPVAGGPTGAPAGTPVGKGNPDAVPASGSGGPFAGRQTPGGMVPPR